MLTHARATSGCAPIPKVEGAPTACTRSLNLNPKSQFECIKASVCVLGAVSDSLIDLRHGPGNPKLLKDSFEGFCE